jgi:hypothetical protein
MISDNLAITEVMVLLNKTVIERLKRGITNQVEFYRAEVCQICLDRILVDLDRKF